ncbi:MAG: thiamine diphosphokinase [Rhodobacterales bacterium]|nr:thiamine diphosphokinase [Rhodobacterales bacterium]
MIVTSSFPVTLVGGAVLRQGDLSTALAFAPILVAADGGAAAVLAAGMIPEAVIGDMDSLPDAAAVAFAGRLHRITEQETTDFDKTLRHVTAPLVVAIGVTGGRFDHELAVMHTLVRYAELPCVVLGAENIIFVCPPVFEVDLPAGSVFSLFPMGPVHVASEGLRWPTTGLDFAPQTLIGTSNEVTGPVRLTADGPEMLVILPRVALGAVVLALTGSMSHWPSRKG